MRRTFVLGFGLFRFGLAVIIARLRRADLNRVVGVELREFLGQMGFAYVKLGQFLALRFDLLPAEVCAELRGLFDHAPTMPLGDVVRQIETELGRPLEENYRSVDSTCIAAGSLAQIHSAVTSGGDRVAIKVQRPNAQRDFEADMWLARLAARGVDALGVLRSLSLTSIVDEFVDTTRQELDFGTEGRVATAVRARTNPGISVPRIHWDLSTSRVLTMDYVEGVTMTTAVTLAREGRTDELDALLPGVDLDDAVRRIADESLRQVLIGGLFHADPHPGNLLLSRDGTITYVDFGSHGRLSRQQREDCAGYIKYNAVGNFERGFQHFYRLMRPTTDVDYRSFRRSSIKVIEVWTERSHDAEANLVERHLGTVMFRTMAAMRLHGVRPAPEFLLFWRVLFQIDSMALELGGKVDMFATVRQFFESNAHSAWLGSELPSGLWPIDAAQARRTVDRGADVARLHRPHSPREVVRSRLRPSRALHLRRVLLPTLALWFVAFAVLLGEVGR